MRKLSAIVQFKKKKWIFPEVWALKKNKKLNKKKIIIGISKMKISKLYMFENLNFLIMNLVILKLIKKVIKNEKTFIDGII